MRKQTYLMVLIGVLLGCIVMLSGSKLSAVNLIPQCSDPAYADTSTCKDVSATQTTSDNKLYGPNGVLTKAAGIITFIGGIAAVIMIILGAFTFITGSGEAMTLAAAKKTILYAVVGLVVIVLPGAIIRFVLSKL